MAEIRVKAVLDTGDFAKQAKELDEQLTKLSQHDIVIKVDTQGVEADIKALAKLAGVTVESEKASARLASAHAREVASANQVATATARLAIEQEKSQRAAMAANKATTSGAKESANAINEVEQATIRFSETLSAMAVRGVWRAITNEIRQSLAAMKEVDRELVTIRKVTGFGQEKISAIGQSAYTVASQYGVLPQDYLESVANFARAGYKDVSTTLGELAVKTQLVGDVSASTANQMLLAVDAAYKYGGSAEKLNAVLDGMNEIDNNFATSIEKISSGLGKVTSIAAQAGVGIDELSAAVGTITAVTQRSGTEAATALRALFLNIMGDTKTEIEDGAKWTAGEINGLRDVINKYAPEVVQAADATKTLINPMEAVAALSKAMKDGLLTEQDLMQMVSDIGGKLRSSQLLALIQNWDMYSAQLDAFRNSAGSAGEEVARMLDSWEVKSNQLSASWMKLTSDVVDTSAIKGVLDILRGIVDVLDVGEGLPAKILSVAAAVTAAKLAFDALKGSSAIGAVGKLLKSPEMWLATGSIVAISAIVGLIDHLNVTQQELEENAKLSADEYGRQKDNLQSIKDQIKENARLMREIAGKGADITGEDRERLRVLQQQTAELERQAKIQGYKTEQSAAKAAGDAAAVLGGMTEFDQGTYESRLGVWQGAYGRAGYNIGDKNKAGRMQYGINDTLAYWTVMNQALEDINAEIDRTPAGSKELETLNEQRQYINNEIYEANQIITDFMSTSSKNMDVIGEYIDKHVTPVPERKRTDQMNDLVKVYKLWTEGVGQIDELWGTETGAATSGTTVGGAAEEPTPSAWQLQTGQHAAQVQALNAAIKEFNDVGVISANTYGLMADAGLDVSDSLIAMDDGYVIAKDDLQKFIDATKAWYEKYGLKMPDTLGEIADQTNETTSSISNLANNALTLQDNAYGAAKAIKDLQDTLKATGEKGDAFKAIQQEYANVMKLIGEGRWNSNEVRGFIDAFFNEEDIRAAGGYQSMTEWLGKDYFKSFFTDDALTTLKKWAKTLGEVRDENDELVASFTQNEDGTFDVFVKDLDELGKQLHIAPDALAAFFDELSNFGELGDIGGVEKLVDGMTEGVKNLEDGTKKVSFDSFVEQLTKAGVASERIRELVSAARDSDKIVFDVDYSQINEADLLMSKTDADKKTLDESAKKPVVLKLNTDDNTEPGITSAKKRIDVSLPKAANIDITATNNTDGPAGEAEATTDIPDVNIDIGATNNTELPAGEAEETVNIPNVDIDIGATDNASGTAGVVKRAVEAIPTEINVKIKATTDGLPIMKTTSGLGTVGGGLSTYGLDAVSGAAPFIPDNASGTDFYEGGPTLINERGPELVADNGRAFIANGGNPAIVSLSRGAIIYDAEKTRELLVGGGIYSRSDGEKEREMANAVFTISKINGKTDDDKGGGGGGNGKKTKPKKSDDDWWKILEESYEYALAKAKDTVSQLDLKITHIKNEIADAKRPLEDQIKEYEKINKQIDRQIQLLNRAKERATKPIQDQIDALKAQKDVQDEQLALEEKQKAVEEARANLQNAQQERTIRFYNQETGHWEWMADQRAIDDAQKNLDSAEKALADQEFNMQISALEREKDRIEKEFDDQITQLNEQKTVNEDAIYALNEAIDAIDDAYAPELNALEREKELMDRELSDTEAEWAHLQFQRQKKPKGNANKAANKLGAKGKAAKEIIDSLSGSIKDIESAAAAGTLDALTASVANSLIYGSPSTVASAVGTGIGYSGGMADSHDIIINGIVFSNEGAYKSFTDGLAALGIYAGE